MESGRVALPTQMALMDLSPFVLAGRGCGEERKKKKGRESKCLPCWNGGGVGEGGRRERRGNVPQSLPTGRKRLPASLAREGRTTASGTDGWPGWEEKERGQREESERKLEEEEVVPPSSSSFSFP